ncbi:hypothetical protein LTR48_005567 [Friedmanniomyces endolithicus]|nr:hypothetical protein LTR48_005567 [Friedmanniomyces endolithicus]
MCISLLSTAHPTYPFILLNNRDEFLSRPTARAHWWDPPNQHVLGGRDLQREIRGTWLAITKDGRIANLTNFRDALESDGEESYDGFVRRLVGEVDVKKVGGFTLLFGRLRKPDGEGRVPGLGVLSNRTSSAEGVFRICGELGETQGLSNSHFGDREWPKVVQGEKLLSEAISGSISRGEDQEGLVERLFGVLSVDTLPRPKPGEDFQAFTKQLRNSILIPPVGGEAAQSKPADKIAAADGTGTPDHSGVKVGDGVYGTQKQTVVLVDMRGRVNFIERTLHDGDGGLDSDDNKDRRRYEFTIEEWER